jgi:hypothetical protein
VATAFPANAPKRANKRLKYNFVLWKKYIKTM